MVCVFFEVVGPCSVVIGDNEVFSPFKRGENFFKTFVEFFVYVCVVDVVIPPFDVHSYNVVGLVVFVVVELVYSVCCVVGSFDVEVVIEAGGSGVCNAFCFYSVDDGIEG